jgi:hypothetical protein
MEIWVFHNSHPTNNDTLRRDRVCTSIAELLLWYVETTNYLQHEVSRGAKATQHLHRVYVSLSKYNDLPVN